MAKQQVADEIGDIITVAFLLADKLGINVEQAVTSKFNRVSDRHGFDIKIPEDADPAKAGTGKEFYKSIEKGEA